MTVNEMKSVVDMKWICVMPPDENEVRKFIHDTSLIDLSVWMFRTIDESVEDNLVTFGESNIDIILRHLSMRFGEFSPDSRVIVEMRNFLSDLARFLKLSETAPDTKDLYTLRYMSYYWKSVLRRPTMLRCAQIAAQRKNL